jgi:hypothetical protein
MNPQNWTGSGTRRLSFPGCFLPEESELALRLPEAEEPLTEGLKNPNSDAAGVFRIRISEMPNTASTPLPLRALNSYIRFNY